MTATQRKVLAWTFWILGLLCIGAGTWWWYANMEKRWETKTKPSEEALKNPLLAATRLLAQQGYTVAVEDSISDILISDIPDGTLILAENSGLMTTGQAQQLLAWAGKGNTLIVRPKLSPVAQKQKKAPEQALPGIDSDPIAEHLGVKLEYDCNCRTKDEKTDAGAEPDTLATPAPPETTAGQKTPGRIPDITLPGMRYPLALKISGASMHSVENAAIPLFSDDSGDAVRVYAEGKGHIVMLADDYFSNRRLSMYDHAEFLLKLAQLNRHARHVLIVQRLEISPWIKLLWNAFSLGIIGLICCVLLLFWRAVRRFGPLLPEPNFERRSLIEHVDASGRWLWQVPGGRDILLSAVRNSLNQVLSRRAPELQRLPFAGQIKRMAYFSRLEPADLISALQDEASRLPNVFTHQIHTLQQLRKHYER